MSSTNGINGISHPGEDQVQEQHVAEVVADQNAQGEQVEQVEQVLGGQNDQEEHAGGGNAEPQNGQLVNGIGVDDYLAFEPIVAYLEQRHAEEALNGGGTAAPVAQDENVGGVAVPNGHAELVGGVAGQNGQQEHGLENGNGHHGLEPIVASPAGQNGQQEQHAEGIAMVNGHAEMQGEAIANQVVEEEQQVEEIAGHNSQQEHHVEGMGFQVDRAEDIEAIPAVAGPVEQQEEQVEATAAQVDEESEISDEDDEDQRTPRASSLERRYAPSLTNPNYYPPIRPAGAYYNATPDRRWWEPNQPNYWAGVNYNPTGFPGVANPGRGRGQSGNMAATQPQYNARSSSGTAGRGYQQQFGGSQAAPTMNFSQGRGQSGNMAATQPQYNASSSSGTAGRGYQQQFGGSQAAPTMNFSQGRGQSGNMAATQPQYNARSSSGTAGRGQQQYGGSQAAPTMSFAERRLIAQSQSWNPFWRMPVPRPDPRSSYFDSPLNPSRPRGQVRDGYIANTPVTPPPRSGRENLTARNAQVSTNRPTAPPVGVDPFERLRSPYQPAPIRRRDHSGPAPGARRRPEVSAERDFLRNADLVLPIDPRLMESPYVSMDAMQQSSPARSLTSTDYSNMSSTPRASVLNAATNDGLGPRPSQGQSAFERLMEANRQRAIQDGLGNALEDSFAAIGPPDGEHLGPTAVDELELGESDEMVDDDMSNDARINFCTMPQVPYPIDYMIKAEGIDIMKPEVLMEISRRCRQALEEDESFVLTPESILTFHQLVLADELFYTGAWRKKFLINNMRVLEYHAPELCKPMGDKRDDCRICFCFLISRRADMPSTWCALINGQPALFRSPVQILPVEHGSLLNLRAFILDRIPGVGRVQYARSIIPGFTKPAHDTRGVNQAQSTSGAHQNVQKNASFQPVSRVPFKRATSRGSPVAAPRSPDAVSATAAEGAPTESESPGTMCASDEPDWSPAP
ncbi:hypothetical protein GGR50DRAFT_696721 [Xylaria sp. CBS 124048]|nr:hypothetical protein GGR50DRAFT_696721 [Xylaria sp. CBS 124048]